MSVDSLVNRKLSGVSDQYLKDLKYSMPRECPICSFANKPTRTKHNFFTYNNNQLLLLLSWQCTNCFQFYFTCHLRERDSSIKDSEYLFIYPNLKTRIFSDNINTLSPRFVEIYKEASYSEQAGHLSSAGIAYRLALEILIKDYAIKELQEEEKEVAKKSLYNSISDYLPDTDFQKVADVIRLKGNDYTHFKEKFEEVDFDTMKDYLNIFIGLVDINLKIKHPPIGNRQ